MGSDLVRILILDDEKVRHDDFDAMYSGHEVTHAYRYNEFVRLLVGSSPWDLIHLDHDLGETEGCDTFLDGWGHVRYFNGYHASARICELHDHQLPDEVIVHSVNPLGAQNILYNFLARRVKASWKPYTTLTRKTGPP
jgi:CheY-like chemotaxis protein